MQEYIDTFKSVFPNSTIIHKKYSFLQHDNNIFTVYLGNDSNCINGIIKNDPLHFSFDISTNGYEEITPPYIFTKPTNKFMVYGSVKIRKKTIRDINLVNFAARLETIKQKIQQLVDTDMIHDNHKNIIKLALDNNL